MKLTASSRCINHWIEAYQRQGLRNALDNCKIVAMSANEDQEEDAFYSAITLRIWAEGNDYTVDRNRQSRGRFAAASAPPE